MQHKDYYHTLGLQKNATAEDIKHAYRQLAHKYHPDVSYKFDAEEQFKEINEAYRVLKNPKKRALYDLVQARLEVEWPFRSDTFKTTPAENPSKILDIPLVWWLLGVLLILYLLATILKQFIVPIVLLLMIYLVLEDLGLELSSEGWIALILIILVLLGIAVQLLATPVALLLMLYLVFKKLLN
jgi:hypothetical protein